MSDKRSLEEADQFHCFSPRKQITSAYSPPSTYITNNQIQEPYADVISSSSPISDSSSSIQEWLANLVRTSNGSLKWPSNYIDVCNFPFSPIQNDHVHSKDYVGEHVGDKSVWCQTNSFQTPVAINRSNVFSKESVKNGAFNVIGYPVADALSEFKCDSSFFSNCESSSYIYDEPNREGNSSNAHLPLMSSLSKTWKIPKPNYIVHPSAAYISPPDHHDDMLHVLGKCRKPNTHQIYEHVCTEWTENPSPTHSILHNDPKRNSLIGRIPDASLDVNSDNQHYYDMLELLPNVEPPLSYGFIEQPIYEKTSSEPQAKENTQEKFISYSSPASHAEPQLHNVVAQRNLQQSPDSCQSKLNDRNGFSANRDMNSGNPIANRSFRSQACELTSSTGLYFWQYNSQCKGPKAIRLVSFEHASPRSEHGPDEPDSTAGCQASNSLGSMDSSEHSLLFADPGDSCSSSCTSYMHSSLSLPGYPLVVFEDPVQRRYDLVHCSKLRRGDGNDVTPNLTRLQTMGEELDCLSQKLVEHGEIIISGLMMASGNAHTSTCHADDLGERSDHSIPTAPDHGLIEQAKREKNKLASKICRLKKKAFHEANKIKYNALRIEYSEMAKTIHHLRRLIQDRVQERTQTVGTEGTFIFHQSGSQYPLSGEVNTHHSHDYPTFGDVRIPERKHAAFSNSLYNQARLFHDTTHITHAAGRTDALVEEVLQLFRSGHTRHPLVRGMTSDTFNVSDTSAVENTFWNTRSTLPSFTIPECETLVGLQPIGDKFEQPGVLQLPLVPSQLTFDDPYDSGYVGSTINRTY